MKLIFIHGRSQQGKSANELKQVWLTTLNEGLAKSSLTLDPSVQIEVPFYGDRLDQLRIKYQGKGKRLMEFDALDQEYETFRGEILQEILKVKKIKDDTEIQQKERGPANWEWVHKILQLLDRKIPAVGDGTLSRFTLDVFLYLTKSEVREEIDGIVESVIPESDAVIVSHSLGTVVAYNVLRRKKVESPAFPLFVTMGSPLGINAIKSKLELPVMHPQVVARWYNAYDERDVVALNPLDQSHFPVFPMILNNDQVRNNSENRHSITGYLNDGEVAKKIADASSSN